MSFAMAWGTIKWFNVDKGYGFIAVEGAKDVFVHLSNLISYSSLEQGSRVEFEVQSQPESGGPRAEAKAVAGDVVHRNSDAREIEARSSLARSKPRRMGAGSETSAAGNERGKGGSAARRSLAGKPAIPVVIYLENEQDASTIEAAVDEVLDHAGYDIVLTLPPVLGSWFSQKWARFRRGIADAGLDGVADKAVRGLELEHVQRRQAEINATNLDALANLIERLDKTPAALIQIGSILLVKTAEDLLVRELTLEEQIHLEANPSLRKDPTAAARVFGVQEQGATEASPPRMLSTD
ncbi:cold-shock protein [Nonomuraea endophytica]